MIITWKSQIFEHTASRAVFLREGLYKNLFDIVARTQDVLFLALLVVVPQG